MITGKFMTSNDDIEKVLEIRGKVFPGSGTRDEIDTLAIYALTFSEDGQPGSSGRLFMDDDNVVTIDLVGTVPELRCQGLGDLVMRMLLYRVLEMELPIVSQSTTNLIFTILPDACYDRLKQEFKVAYQHRTDESHCLVRLCTSWATREEAVDRLCALLREAMA